MQIESVRIKNFRSFKDETIKLDNFSCFVGPNGSGKSTIINALNVFFRQNKDSKTDLSKLSIDDFHHKDTSEDIEITVTFCDLSDQAKDDLKDYVRLGKLIISSIAKYNSSSDIAEVKQFGNRIGLEDFKKFFELDKEGAKVVELKTIFEEFQQKYPELRKASSKADMITAMHEYETANPDRCVIIPSEDQFYGISRGSNKLEPHIQWIFIPASKDVTEESEESRTSALGQLLSRTVRSKISFDTQLNELRQNTRAQYQSFLDAEQSALDDISKSLQYRLASWSHPNITAQVLWKQDPDKSIKIEEPWAYIKLGERGFESDLSRFGHGLQRSFMLALLQELTQYEIKDVPTLIMGIEEPEIYQHPPQARYLAETLIDLSTKNSQVLICTHSPLFIPGDNFDKIRIIRESGEPSYSTVNSITYDALASELQKAEEKLIVEAGMVAKLYPSLDPITSEMFFCRVLILVEGNEDVAFIMSYMMLTGLLEDYRKLGCHIVPVSGKNRLIKPIAMSKLLNIPTYVVFDADTNKDQITNEDRRKSEVTKHKKDNKAILTLVGHSSEDDWPSSDIIKDNLTCWNTNLTDKINTELNQYWKDYRDKSAFFYGNVGDLEKNPLAIAKAIELAWQDNVKSKILTKLVEDIISFAKSTV